MKHTKISIIGAGAVGTTIAYALMLRNIAAEIQLVDVNEEHCHGEVLDLSDVLPFSSTSTIKLGTFKDTHDSQIIIIAAGARQKIGQDRISLYNANKDVVSSIINNLKPIAKEAIIIMVTNPLDLLTLQAQKESGLPRNQLFGAGTFLDSQRLRNILSHKLGIAEQSIHAYVLGEHGDTQFVAWSCASAGGIPLTTLIDAAQRDVVAKQTKEKAYEIIKCKGATFWGIATCTAALCRTIIFNQKMVTPLSVYLEKFDVCLSMPVVLGENGIERILDIPLSDHEKKQLEKSAQAVKKLL